MKRVVRKLSAVTLLCVVISALTQSALAQAADPRLTLVSDPLDADSIAIYKIVLLRYANGLEGPTNVSNKTVPLEPTELDEKPCVPGLDPKPQTELAPLAIHLLVPDIFPNPRFVFVDPEVQAEKIRASDPQAFMKKAMNDNEEITDKQLELSVKEAFASGVLTLSEIRFDKTHTNALVEYGFSCGELCGSGEVLALKKVGKEWKVSKKCGSWIS